jgi:DNA-binding response OmpR family regulator
VTNELKILVVDDIPSQLLTIKDILGAEQFAVITASDAADATRQFNAAQPDIVLLDVNLPDGNGLELTSQFKQSHNKKWLPVLLMSSDATVDDHLAGYKAGCDDYLGKPFDPRILLAKLTVIRHQLELLSR